jgi:hypothetical protein
MRGMRGKGGQQSSSSSYRPTTSSSSSSSSAAAGSYRAVTNGVTNVEVSDTQQQAHPEAISQRREVSDVRQRAHKDKHKARIGNHNRKRGADKKLNRAMGQFG